MVTAPLLYENVAEAAAQLLFSEVLGVLSATALSLLLKTKMVKSCEKSMRWKSKLVA